LWPNWPLSQQGCFANRGSVISASNHAADGSAADAAAAGDHDALGQCDYLPISSLSVSHLLRDSTPRRQPVRRVTSRGSSLAHSSKNSLFTHTPGPPVIRVESKRRPRATTAGVVAVTQMRPIDRVGSPSNDTTWPVGSSPGELRLPRHQGTGVLTTARYRRREGAARHTANPSTGGEPQWGAAGAVCVSSYCANV
jgi:hypothetical protein